MASLTTYLLVSGVEDPTNIEVHPTVEAHGLEVRDTTADAPIPRITLVDERPLEEADDLSGAARALSEAFPDATVLLSTVEERFDQIERVETVLFRDGKNAGKIEHGYVFNVGRG